jgi:transcriptional/translational regulatory protein YebC/TACO1
MSTTLTNHINQSKKNKDVPSKNGYKMGTKSVHFRYNDSGILGISRNKKSSKTNCFEAFLCGADEARTRDLLRDRLS